MTALEAATGEDLSLFRIPDSEMKHKALQATRASRRRPGSVVMSEKRYCDDQFMRRQIEGIASLGPKNVARTSKNNPQDISNPQHAPDPRKVFVIHGRNIEATDALFSFLRALDLAPIEWEEAVAMTGKGSPYRTLFQSVYLPIRHAIYGHRLMSDEEAGTTLFPQTNRDALRGILIRISSIES